MDPADAAELLHRRELAHEAVVIYLHHLAVELALDACEDATEADVARTYRRLLEEHGWGRVLLMLEPLESELNS